MSFSQYLPKSVKRSKEKQDLVQLTSSFINFVETTGVIAEVKNAVDEVVSEYTRETLDITEDVNILQIDRRVQGIIAKRRECIPYLQKKLKRMEWISKNGLDSLDKSLAKERIKDLQSDIEDLESDSELHYYYLITHRLITRYRELNKQEKKVFFSFDTDTTSKESASEKNYIITKYLSFVREFVNLKGFKQTRVVQRCEMCNSVNLIQVEHQTFECECGYRTTHLDNTPSYKDTDRANMCDRYKYSRKNHLVDAINRFQGKQSKTIPESVIDYICGCMNEHNLTKFTVTKNHIHTFLTNSRERYNNYYSDINLIYSIVADEEPPNIGIFERDILQLYSQYNDVKKDVAAYISEIYGKERSNSLNVDYILYKLMQLVDYPCLRNDFYMLRTEEKMNEHDEIWDIHVNILMDKFPRSKWRHIPS